jgi:hypothetical protein
MTEDEFHEQYVKFGHAIQTGIKFVIEMERKGGVGTDNILKHHRVGIDTAKCEHGALSRLLVRKGIISESDYFDAVIEGMKMEVKLYEDKLANEFGVHITLG